MVARILRVLREAEGSEWARSTGWPIATGLNNRCIRPARGMLRIPRCMQEAATKMSEEVIVKTGDAHKGADEAVGGTGGAIAGGLIGAAVGGPIGAVAGAAIGGAAGIAAGNNEADRHEGATVVTSQPDVVAVPVQPVPAVPVVPVVPAVPAGTEVQQTTTTTTTKP
jgi:phage tail tape-measure protein